MLELNLDKETADALWDASHENQPAVLTVFHDGKVIQFRLSVTAAEMIQHGPTEWRHGKPYTVRLKLAQLIDVPQTVV
jgi:hypothetical protein